MILIKQGPIDSLGGQKCSTIGASWSRLSRAGKVMKPFRSRTFHASFYLENTCQPFNEFVVTGMSRFMSHQVILLALQRVSLLTNCVFKFQSVHQQEVGHLASH